MQSKGYLCRSRLSTILYKLDKVRTSSHEQRDCRRVPTSGLRAGEAGKWRAEESPTSPKAFPFLSTTTGLALHIFIWFASPDRHEYMDQRRSTLHWSYIRQDPPSHRYFGTIVSGGELKLVSSTSLIGAPRLVNSNYLINWAPT